MKIGLEQTERPVRVSVNKKFQRECLRSVLNVDETKGISQSFRKDHRPEMESPVGPAKINSASRRRGLGPRLLTVIVRRQEIGEQCNADESGDDQPTGQAGPIFWKRFSCDSFHRKTGNRVSYKLTAFAGGVRTGSGSDRGSRSGH